MDRLIVIGAGGHAAVVADAAVRAGFTVAGFLDDSFGTAPLPEYRVLGPIRYLADVLALDDGLGVVVAIGDNRVRMGIVDMLHLPPDRYATVTDPSAVVSTYAVIGPGAVVLQGAMVNARSAIGSHTIINTGCTVDHDCVVHDYAHISPGANLAGGVSIGLGAHVGTGACIIPGRAIGSWAIVGAGAAVIRDVPDAVTVVGVPGRIVTAR